MTNDRIQALTGGHGMLNLSVYAVANVLAEELMRGADVKVRFANVHSQQVDDVLKKAVESAKAAGADAANAALIAAVMLYLCGTEVQVGVPSGNRKLGAMARIVAGVDRCGIAAVPTGKMNNKVSGFPAVQAVYQAMVAGKLSPISGRSIPENVGGGPLHGHSSLGEDIIFPAMAENGAKVGTQAMQDAMAGAGMPVHPFTAALFGAAAILEIIHPDAALPEKYGPYHERTSVYLAGKSAVETAGLPEKVHVRITGEEYDTAALIGDLGLLLKDIGGPTVIGMMAFDEIIACFQESLAGFSGGPLNPPLGHICSDAVVALKVLRANKWNQAETAQSLCELRHNTSIDPEVALVAMNTVARKAAEVRPGPITDTLIQASEPARIDALYRRAERTRAGLDEGKSLADIVKEIEAERQGIVEARASAMFSQMAGKDIKVHVTKLVPGARRKGKLVETYIAFDPLADVDITVDGQTTKLKGVIHDLIPKVAKGERDDIAWAIPMVAAVLDEMTLMGNTIMNVTVPAAVAAAMGVMSPIEAAETASANAPLTTGIPGAKFRAELVANLAVRIVEYK
jgi:hypothetical protein